jgi:hypothetical protein
LCYFLQTRNDVNQEKMENNKIQGKKTGKPKNGRQAPKTPT